MSQTTSNRSDAERPALVIGVTGHRYIDPRDEQLNAIVGRELESLRDGFPGHTFTIVSPLAEGADRLVARAAMDVLEARLIVPLPLPLNDTAGYRMDFPASVSEFESLLARADDVFEGPLRSRGDGWRDYTPQRNRQYAWVGAYVVEHCQVLIALWDGKPARGIGGTALVVNWFLSGRVPKTHSTLALRHAGPLPPAKPELLVHIQPDSGQVAHKRCR